MAWEKRMRTIKRNSERELKQKLLTPASRDNGIKRRCYCIDSKILGAACNCFSDKIKYCLE